MNTLKHSTYHEETKMAECLQAYFDNGEATWSQVVRAVAMHPIKDKRLARKIANDHNVDFDMIITWTVESIVSKVAVLVCGIIKINLVHGAN